MLLMEVILQNSFSLSKKEMLRPVISKASRISSCVIAVCNASIYFVSNIFADDDEMGKTVNSVLLGGGG
jgi:hypothetical protein